VLVVLVRRSLVERFERALESLGARAGLVDISTPNLMNLYRGAVNGAARNGGDAGLLNCARNYFSLVLVRDGRLIFFRCKTFGIDEAIHRGPNGVLVREIASSLSYYREKLDGETVGRIFVRSISAPFDEIAGRLTALGVTDVQPLDPQREVELDEGVSLDAAMAQQLAPALGAALGRSR
jgi:hypothetical protein